MYSLILVFLITITCHQVDPAAPKMPKQFVRCKRDDPEINGCLKNAIQKALPVLSKGIPKVGVIPIDPLLTTTAIMEQRYGPVNLIVKFTNFTTTGLEQSKILRARSDVKNYKVGADVLTKKIVIEGRYFVDGSIFFFPLQGEGPFKLILDDVQSSLNVVGEKNLKRDIPHMQVKRFDASIIPRGINIRLDNLFGGNTFLGERANKFLNSYSNDIYAAMRSTFEATIGLIFKELAKRFYDKVPYEEIYY